MSRSNLFLVSYTVVCSTLLSPTLAFVPQQSVRRSKIATLPTFSSGNSATTTKVVTSPPLLLSPLLSQPPRRYSVHLTTTDKRFEDEPDRQLNIFQKAKRKFQDRPGTYLLIPVIAALVGWLTNYLAVQMIFYPIQYKGINIKRWPEVPGGLFGWQGIVPCKTKTMSIALVDMVTSQLLTVSEAFARLNPKVMAKMFAPEIPSLGAEVIGDVAPGAVKRLPFKIWHGLSNRPWGLVRSANVQVFTTLIKRIQENIESIFSLENCVVNQMVQDRGKLGELFREVGQKELDFLTNSGLWFGFLLGLIQMAVALVWENPWSLSIGGCIVGLATNWLALKWIFEPVNPTKFGIGPFSVILQGQFLRRQKEVSAAFSKFFADKILASPNLWNTIFTDPSTTPAFHELVAGYLKKFVSIVSLGAFRGLPRPDTVNLVASKAIEKMPNHVHVLHKYIDKTLGLEHTLRTKMELMTPAKFERVLHPIFEEDELTLIIAGGVLGFAAGLIQQGIETGAIQFKSPMPKIRRFLDRLKTLLKGNKG